MHNTKQPIPAIGYPPVNIDAVLIERVFWNLIENAIKYSPEDFRVEVSVKRRDDHIGVDVCDRGPGIDLDRREQLFGLFQRGKIESEVPGVGLGLSIAKTIVEAHGGNISARNRDGGGSCFRIQLPVGNPPIFEEMDGKPCRSTSRRPQASTRDPGSWFAGS